MLIDITLKITPKMVPDAQGNERKVLAGHVGTHFDVMNKEFPLEYTERKGIVFDVHNVTGREISCQDIDFTKVEADMFVAFYTGFIEDEGYGGKKYFTEHPTLSQELIDQLLERNISIIGVDFAGIRRGEEHVKADQYCADHNVFVVENLCNLKAILQQDLYAAFAAGTYPMNYGDMTGLPCRIIAKI